MQPTTDTTRPQRLELILQQLESLPTLPAVAMQLLAVTADDTSSAKQVIELVKSDPAMSSKILSMCRFSKTGSREAITTIDRAVVLLGFEAIRNAVLSIKVFELFADDEAESAKKKSKGDGAATRKPTFDRPAFWLHSLAVAIAAEHIADAHDDQPWLPPGEAFICGLLHDIGKLALDHLLPKSYERVIELTEQHQLNIADVERRVIGVDHHIVGKRLAEHWRLPHVILDTIWLHGSSYQTLPDLPHRQMVGLIGVADLLVRRQHLGYSGNYQIAQNLKARAEEVGLDYERVQQAADALHEELERRAAAIGLGQAGDTPSRKLFLESIMQANTVLGRLNSQLEARRRQSAGQTRTLDAIADFQITATEPGRSVGDVMALVAQSAAAVLGEGYWGLVYQPGRGQPWLLSQYGRRGRLVHSQFISHPAMPPQLPQLDNHEAASLPIMGLLPWLGDFLVGDQNPQQVRMMPLPCGWGTAAVLLHDRATLPAESQLKAMIHTWGAAIAGAAQHQGARRLGEQLVEVNRELTQMQATLLRNQSLARLGEMAAGAAHEMNNPLAVISGRAQLLSSRLEANSREQQDAHLIAQQAQRLSDLITALRHFADPPSPKKRSTSAQQIIDAAAIHLRRKHPDIGPLNVRGIEQAPPLDTDPDQLAEALAELLYNAVEASPKQPIQVATLVDPVNDRFLFTVIDDGAGMDAPTLEHAFDPFYSAKAAGRQMGVGLAKVKRIMEGLGGDVELTSQPGKGTKASLSIPLPTGAHSTPDAAGEHPQQAPEANRVGRGR